MFLGFLFKKEPRVPLSTGEFLEIRIPLPKSPEKPTSEESVRYLYGQVIKISKKRNIFLRFTSKDKGDDLEVGTAVTLAAVKPRKVIRFPSKFLHRNDDTLIFAPPVTITNVELPADPEKATFIMSSSVEYRSFNTMHLQKGTLLEIAENSLVILANLAIPQGTGLSLEVFLPYRENPVRIKVRVRESETAKAFSRHKIHFSIEEISPEDKEGLLRFAFLSNLNWE